MNEFPQGLTTTYSTVIDPITNKTKFRIVLKDTDIIPLSKIRELREFMPNIKYVNEYYQHGYHYWIVE